MDKTISTIEAAVRPIFDGATVMIGGKPAARMGDSTAHGGTIVMGCPTVLIGG